MPTTCCGRYEKWCREASTTKENNIEAIENKKSIFQKACENEKGYKLQQIKHEQNKADAIRCGST